ncbi:MAG: histidine--tRNA ligase [Candidatus Shapirobacteria bacterium]|nr:histidine--tRNA ligase [Candidatus Shapirobacteria bacterium]MDD4410341.1 histidine--tRNA ligase [Candidatus Shapirobacteria bacterium]
MTKPQTLKGFRDFLPKDMGIRNYVKNTLIEVFENYGFLPLETPALEYASVLKGKYSNETDDKLGYFFKDNGDREIGLRYDLTVPAAKVLAIYSNDLQLPFKRYQIQPVWRAENTQKGRYREFVQCDIDIFGTSSPIADAEIISIIYAGVQKLNFKNAIISINSRQVLFDILAKSAIEKDQNSVLQSLDKIGKIGEDGVINELKSKALSQSQITNLFKYIKEAQPDEKLKLVLNKLEALGLPDNSYIFDPTLVRGCDYYTGTIFEVSVTEPKIGAIGGGGRYDNLVSTLGGPNIPAVGFAFGFERVVDVIQELNLLPQANQSKTKILVANFGPETESNILNLVSNLRDKDIASIVYPDNDKLAKQIKYALSLGINYLAIIGPDEAKNNQITVKNLITTEQKLVSFDELIKIIN